MAHPSDRDPIEFRVLGPLEAVRDGEALPVGGPRQRALLALLLLRPGRPVPAGRLVEELWQGRPPAGAVTTLRSYVSRLRRVLGAGAPITMTAAGYALEVAEERIDAQRFARLAGEGHDAAARASTHRAAELFRAALALWRGPPFSGVGDDGEVRREAERLEELRLIVLQGRFDAELALGAGAGLVHELEELVGAHPYRERFREQLMLALYRAGRQADALAVLREGRRVLRRDLGLEPGEGLRRLEGAILRHEVPPPSARARHALPAPLTSFIGRAGELAELQRLLRERRLVTLTGIGGVGKTRLALAAAARVAPTMRDGVVVVELAGLTEAPAVAREVARVVSLHEDGGRSATEQLVASLGEAEMLLVLDNCEHLLPSCAELVGLLLPACPRLRVLATSREPLGVPGEVDLRVSPLALPPPGAAGETVRSSDAVRLCLERAREARPGLVVDGAAVETAAAICRELDGLPLAIELAAARAKALSLAQIADRLADRFRFLVSGHRTIAPRHRTLEATMDWSHDLLPVEEQQLLAGLSVFVGGFTLPAVGAVCLDGDEEAAFAATERLVDASLVVADERDGEMRYRLLETVRRYAADRLARAGGTDALRRRHAEFVLALAEQAEGALRRSVQSPWGARLHAEYGNVTAALAWSVETGRVDLGLRIAAALARLWIERDYAPEADRWLELLLRDAEDGSPEVRAKASLAAWNVASVRGDGARAERYARQAFELSRASGDDGGSAWALLALGALHEQRGEPAEARGRLRAALELFRGAGDEPGVRRALQLLGNIAAQTGDFAEARRLLGEALELSRVAEDPFHRGGILHSLADTELEAGGIDAAEALYLEALEVARRIGGHRIACYCLGGLGALAAMRDDARAAAHLWSGAGALERELRFRMRPSARRRYELRLSRVPLADASSAYRVGSPADAIIATALRLVSRPAAVA